MCTHTNTHAHAYTYTVCARTCKKSLFILEVYFIENERHINSTVMRTYTHKHTHSVSYTYVRMYILSSASKEPGPGNDLVSFCVREKGMRDRAEGEKERTVSFFNVCVRVCWRWCCLPSTTPSLCPQVTQTHWDDCQELGRDAPGHFCDTVSVTGGDRADTGSLTHKRARFYMRFDRLCCFCLY